MNKSAFTIIELVVYGALLGLLSLLAFGFCNVLRDTLSISGGRARCALQNALIIDTIRRDLMSASMQRDAWDEKKGVFTMESIDVKGNLKKRAVGWECVKNRAQPEGMMRRSQGTYDFVRSRWISRSVSLLASSIDQLRLVPIARENSGNILRVMIRYDEKDLHKQHVVVLRNRVYSET